MPGRSGERVGEGPRKKKGKGERTGEGKAGRDRGWARRGEE